MVIRAYEETDRGELSRIWSIAFRGGRPRPEEEPIVEDNSVYVAEKAGKLVGGFTIEHMTATRGEATLRCGGVAAVAVLPEHRHEGIGRDMMLFALNEMKAKGFAVSSLYAFREGYYRAFGWECCGKRFKIQVPTEKLPDVKTGLAVRQASSDEWGELRRVYERFARRYSGMNIRTESQWRWVVREGDPQPHVYIVGNPAEAYLIIRQLGEFWGDTQVSEVVWDSIEGYDGVLATLRNLGINRTSIWWYEPSDGPFVVGNLERGVEVSLSRPIMFRAIDVRVALEGLVAEGEGEFTLGIEDELIPSNRGPFRVRYSPAGVSVEDASSAELEMDVRQFTQALLGEPSLDRLLVHGLVRVRSEGAAKAACSLLSARPTYCLDFF